MSERETSKQKLPLLIRNRPTLSGHPNRPEPVRQLPFRVPSLGTADAIGKMSPQATPRLHFVSRAFHQFGDSLRACHLE
jgi:hypothetical protein